MAGRSKLTVEKRPTGPERWHTKRQNLSKSLGNDQSPEAELIRLPPLHRKLQHVE